MGSKQQRSAALSLEQQHRERARKERKERRRQQRQATRQVPHQKSGRRLEHLRAGALVPRNGKHPEDNYRDQWEREQMQQQGGLQCPPEHAAGVVRARLAEFLSYFWPVFVLILAAVLAVAVLKFAAEAL